jgi:hypothetical protein
MPSTAALEAAIRVVNETPTDESRRTLQQELQAAWVCMGSRNRVDGLLPLVRPCDRCATANEPDASFCKRCGTTLLTGATRDHAAVSLVDTAGRLQTSLTLPFLTGMGPHGPVLHVFTSEAELRRRSPAAYALWLPGKALRELVEHNDFRGVVLNPEGPWAFVDRTDL